tara:strand:+ start:319 stop:756 length:438 start_codon:yes stop_codon:yes gene_type:complete
MSFLISIDPGNKKCGLILADLTSGNVIEGGISPLSSFSDLVIKWNEKFFINEIIVGNGTNCKNIQNKLKEMHIFNLTSINESGSTLRARFRYWEIWPPSYFIRWLPKEILFPPENLDAIVALILAEDFLQYRLVWPKKKPIKIWP